MSNPWDALNIFQSIAPLSATTASSLGALFDWSGYNGIAADVNVGAMSASATALTAVLEERDGYSSGTFVSVDTLTLDQADQNQCHKLSGRRQASSKKYARLRFQRSGGAVAASGSIIGVDPKQAPVE